MSKWFRCDLCGVAVTPVFRTERLLIRPLLPEDADLFFQAVDQDREHLGKWLPWISEHHSPAHSENLIEAGLLQLEMDNGGYWGFFSFEGTFLGVVTLHWIQWDHLAASMGYWILSSQQGQGYATEACFRLLHYCFSERGLNRVELSVATENTRSLALIQRLGFAEEGCRRQYERLHGRFWDHYSYALLAENWLRE